MYLFGGFGSDEAVSWECQNSLHQALVNGLYLVYELKQVSSPAAATVKQALGNMLGEVGSAKFLGLVAAVRGGTLKAYAEANILPATGYIQLDSALQGIPDVLGQWQAELAKNLGTCIQGNPSVFTATPTPLLPITAEPVAVTSAEARTACEAKLTTTEWNAGYFCDDSGRLKQTGADGVERWVVDTAVIARINARVPQYIGDPRLLPVDPRKLVPTGPGAPAVSTVSAAAGGGSTGAVLVLGGAAVLAALMMRG